MGLTPWQREVVAAVVYANVWSLLYYFCLRTPIPREWSLQTALWAGIGATFVGGALCRITSPRIWAVGAGAAVGIVLGASQAFVTDYTVSTWQQVYGGLTGVGPYPLFVWMASTTGWAAAELGVRLWRRTMR